MTDKTKDNRGVKLLHDATRPFAEESLTKSWWYTGSTLVLLAIVLTGAGLISWWPVRIALSILGGLLMVRAFVMYHDFMHRAILRKSRFGKMVYHLYGLISLTPARSWRHSHNFHHANVGKPIPVQEKQFSLLTSDIGAVPLMTAEMWKQTTPMATTTLPPQSPTLHDSVCLCDRLSVQHLPDSAINSSPQVLGWSVVASDTRRNHCRPLGVRRFSGGVFRIPTSHRHCRCVRCLFVFCPT